MLPALVFHFDHCPLSHDFTYKLVKTREKRFHIETCIFMPMICFSSLFRQRFSWLSSDQHYESQRLTSPLSQSLPGQFKLSRVPNSYNVLSPPLSIDPIPFPPAGDVHGQRRPPRRQHPQPQRRHHHRHHLRNGRRNHLPLKRRRRRLGLRGTECL